MDKHIRGGLMRKQNNPSKIVKSNPNTRNISSNIPVFDLLNQKCSTATIPNASLSSLKSSSIKTSNHSKRPKNKPSNSRVNTSTKSKSLKSRNPANIPFVSRKVHHSTFQRHCASIDSSQVKSPLDGTPNDTVSPTISSIKSIPSLSTSSFRLSKLSSPPVSLIHTNSTSTSTFRKSAIPLVPVSVV